MKLGYRLYDKKLKTKYIIQGIRNIWSINILDTVIYDGKRCFVNNGTSHPVWDLIVKDTRESLRVNEQDFKKEISFSNIINAIRSSYRFNISYWHRIRMREWESKHKK